MSREQFLFIILGALATLTVILIHGIGDAFKSAVELYQAKNDAKIALLQAEHSANTDRINKLENGGGDAKIDSRLIQHGLMVRKDNTDVGNQQNNSIG